MFFLAMVVSVMGISGIIGDLLIRRQWRQADRLQLKKRLDLAAQQEAWNRRKRYVQRY